MKKHALVIGGTGMLKRVIETLCKEGFHVSVMGRSPEHFKRMMKEISAPQGMISFIQADYYKSDRFKEGIKQAVRDRGMFDLAATWMRSDASDSFQWLLQYIAKDDKLTELYEIKGSHASREPFEGCDSANLKWVRIILGFRFEGGRARWLTHEEISDGVLEAIRQKASLYTAGVTEPWEKRPL
jgi:short chain dehydrogenase